jgi:hypothetical protein
MHTIDQLRSGQLAGIHRLTLSCELTVFPPEILDLADSLEILDLSGNQLTELPDDLARLTRLRVIFCSNNRFTSLPEVLGRLPELSMIGFKANRIRAVTPSSLPPKLRWLILTDNDLEEIPNEIGRCDKLQKLMLAGNRLQNLPSSLAACQRLELLRIAENNLSELPPWLLALPRLSWLAYSGNPFSAALEAEALTSASIGEIPWRSLQLEELLGEGASGIIHRATASLQEEPPPAVAVKLFKGAITSDGSPGAEIASAVRAGTHPHLIGAIGRVSDHPSGILGLVLELITGDFEPLAGPPSLESCTRDIYASSTTFDMTTVLLILRSIASAAQHLHERGIMHGDLYAHNILFSRDDRALIGDFGAASVYASANRPIAEGLQRLEVRAFGCLLEELIEKCTASPEQAAALNSLNDLKSACLSSDHASRPLFQEINSILGRL